MRDRYSELLRQESPCEKIIKRDIARTFPEHEFFRDKNGAGQKGKQINQWGIAIDLLNHMHSIEFRIEPFRSVQRDESVFQLRCGGGLLSGQRFPGRSFVDEHAGRGRLLRTDSSDGRLQVRVCV